MRFIPFTSPSDPGWDEAWKLYEDSFPRKERRTRADHLRALADPRYRAEGIWDDGRLAGLFYWWLCDDGLCYAEHLAVQPALRGRNIGSRALAEFCADHPRIVLEIDPPEDEISIRRLGFYRRLGFVDNPQEYLHPSFSAPFETHRLVLMSRPGPLTDAEVRRLADFVRDPVLRYSEHDDPRLP